MRQLASGEKVTPTELDQSDRKCTQVMPNSVRQGPRGYFRVGGGGAGLNRSRKCKSSSGMPRTCSSEKILKFASTEMAGNALRTGKQLYIDKNIHH